MKRNIIIKIALGIAIAALVFSVVTLIRTIIIRGSILIGIVQVIGTAIVVVICGIMLYVMSQYDDSEFEDEDEDEEEEVKQEDRPQEDTYDTDEELETPENSEPQSEIDQLLSDLETEEKGYNLADFE